MQRNHHSTDRHGLDSGRDLGSVLFDFCIPEFGAACGGVGLHRNAAKRIGFQGWLA